VKALVTNAFAIAVWCGVVALEFAVERVLNRAPAGARAGSGERDWHEGWP